MTSMTENLDHVAERLASLGCPEKFNYFVPGALERSTYPSRYIEWETRTPDAAWVRPGNPFVRAGDRVEVDGEGTYIVILTEYDKYTSSLPVLVYKEGAENHIRWIGQGDSWIVLERYVKPEPEPEPKPAWVTERSPLVKKGDMVRVLSDRGASGQNAYVDDAIIGKVCKVIGTMEDPDGEPTNWMGTPDRHPIRVVHPDRASLRQYVGHYEVVSRAGRGEWEPTRGELVKVLEAHRGASNEWRDFIVGRTVRYRKVDEQGEPEVDILESGVAALPEFARARGTDRNRAVGKVGPLRDDVRIGDRVRVTEVAGGASAIFRESLMGRVVEYRGEGFADGFEETLPLVRLLPPDSWPEGIWLDQRSVAHVSKVEFVSDGTEPEAEPVTDWAGIISGVLEDVHTLACEQEWCGEYERQMLDRFGIEPPDRQEEPVDHDWTVEVKLTSSVDPDKYITLEAVFGPEAAYDGNIWSDQLFDVSMATTLTMTRREEPDAEDIHEYLVDLGYKFDSYEVERITDDGEA